jgi:hypothetical protein
MQRFAELHVLTVRAAHNSNTVTVPLEARNLHTQTSIDAKSSIFERQSLRVGGNATFIQRPILWT